MSGTVPSVKASEDFASVKKLLGEMDNHNGLLPEKESEPNKQGRPRRKRTEKLWVVHLSTFPPRQCGIATFTQDTTNAMDEMLSPMIQSKIVAMNSNEVVSYSYPGKVIFQLAQDNERDYVTLASKINQMHEIRLVNIQHEFGIYGGKRGSHLISFVETLKKPSVINFHTVLPNPDDELSRIVQSLAENVSAITVMTNLSKKILVQEYNIPRKKIRVIPHGIHSQPFTSSRQAKMALGFSDRVVLSTFGLLNRGKGLEYVIEALPEVVKRFPNFVYIYFGATHPVIVKEEGEKYRNEIIEKIYQLGLFDHVKLYNRFFPLGELLRFLKATDIYISPGLEPNQAVSGTLTYALGMGRPVISTAFANARELITNDVGILVDFRNAQAYTKAILELLENEESRLQMGRNAYFKTRWMIWPNVAVQLANLFSEHAPSLAPISEKKSLPKIKLGHLIHLTDDFGIVQFAKLTHPDPRSGYTLDDNARALVAVASYYGKFGASPKDQLTIKQRRDLQKLMNTYLEFIGFVSRDDGKFQNYVKDDRTPDQVRNESVNLEDSNSRALRALAVTATTGSLPQTIRRKALELLQERCRYGLQFQSPRAVARWVKTLCLLIEKKLYPDGLDLEKALREKCDQLVKHYQNSASPDWQWFEGYLTYSNAIMPEALLMAYRITGEERYLEVGKVTLDFLIEQSFVDDIYVPVGQDGWHYKNEEKNSYDQQPEEVKAMVCALKACYAVTRDEYYDSLMRRAFYWFLGDNSLHQVVYDRTSGGCYDGVGKKTVNLNQGAESTISYLLARLAF